MLDEVKKSDGDIILFIDELHNIVGAGKTEGSMDAGNLLKAAACARRIAPSARPRWTNTANIWRKDRRWSVDSSRLWSIRRPLRRPYPYCCPREK